MQVMKRMWLIVFFYAVQGTLNAQPMAAQQVVSGPVLGQVELRTASVWMEVSQQVKSVVLKYWKISEPGKIYLKPFRGALENEFNPVRIDIGGLDMNTPYQYEFLVNGKPVDAKGHFITKDLWQWRNPAPDFSFLTGSCAYFNEAVYDRPGKPYGGDSTIFETMAKTPAAFMVWLGDNWYTRESDYLSEWGLWYRASHDRSLKVLQPFWKSMPQYAIWDDHDYGPDNSDGTYYLKDASRKLFMSYWCNPSYGEDGKGIYTKISYGDADIFLTDDRYFRSSDDLLDSIDGKPNPDKHFFGRKQLEWLENALVNSGATFKIIAVGSQVLNPINDDFECLRHYSWEYQALMHFLDEQKLEGIVFLSGDRHHSEVIKAERVGHYTLYDITTSPFTSGIAKVRGIEINSPFRIPNTLVEAQNFSRISISGKKGERTLLVEFIGIKGDKKAEWSVNEKELKEPGRK
jgi:alkaline phosphatase D